MRLLYINPHRDRDLDDPDQLLERYGSTRLWCAAVAGQGIDVTVWQAFPREEQRRLDGARYCFRPFPRRPDRHWPGEIAALGPDVVHLDGLISPLRLFRLLAACGKVGVPALVQDHGGRRGPGPGWRAAAAVAPRGNPAALLFSAAELAAPWLNAAIFPRETPVIEVMESSTTFTPESRHRARTELGLEGDPLVVSVGRLNRGKDPATLLAGFAAFAESRPGARLALVYHEAPLLRMAEKRIGDSPALAGRVTLLGRLPREKVRLALSAAQLFASASRHEGSGYAALEALACGAVPVLSAIPSFRAMTGGGRVGALFTAGSAGELGRALERVCREGDRHGWDRAREQALHWFQDQLGVEALGKKAAAAYARVADGRAG
jgi:glycosyltransferase involved in cell wall biosynthesis